jgi:hypothetical protein
MTSEKTPKALEADETCLRVLRLRGPYVRLASRQLVGVFLCVYALDSTAGETNFNFEVK